MAATATGGGRRRSSRNSSSSGTDASAIHIINLTNPATFRFLDAFAGIRRLFQIPPIEDTCDASSSSVWSAVSVAIEDIAG